MTDLVLLRERCAKDPSAYKDDFISQLKHFESSFEMISLNPEENSKGFSNLVVFISSLCKQYKKETEHVPMKLLNFIEQHAKTVSTQIRVNVVNALVQYRKQSLIQPKVLLPAMFKLFRINDKQLRKIVYNLIIGDIVNMNEKKNDIGMNRYLQNFMYQMLDDPNRIAAKKSLDVMIQLYYKRIWNDERTVNVISSACLSADANISTAGLKFFLGTNAGVDDEDEINKKKSEAKESNAKKKLEKMNGNSNVSKKTKKKERAYKKAVKQLHKSERDKEKYEDIESKAAIEMLNDPQTFAEKLFGKLKNSNFRFEVRIMLMDVISRCIAYHQLVILNFYSYFQKYLEPYQTHITKILAICAQAAHELVPPELLESIVMIIANKFVNDRSSPESISAGLNTIREICSRQPRVMSKTLLSDLTRYIKSKNKYIVQSARGLVTLFREIDPLMLRRRDRGKDTDLTNKIQPFGSTTYDEIDGIDLLNAFKQGKIDPDELEDISSGSEDEDGDFISDDDSDEDGITITEDDILNSRQGDSEEEEEEEEEDDENDDMASDEEDEGVDENGVVWKIKKVTDSDSDSDDSESEDDMMGGEDIQNSEDDEDDSEEEEEGSDDEIEVEDDLMGGEDIEHSEEEASDEDDSEEEEVKEKPKEKTKEEIAAEKEKFLSSEILTQEDFDLIKKLKKLKSLKKISKKNMKPSQFVDLADIESSIKKKRKDLIADGEMPEKEKFKWERRKKEAGSKTNSEKKKNKPFMMTKHSFGVRKKVKMGTNEKKWRKEKSMKKQIKFQIKHH
eukprot:gene3835-6995_t